MFGLSDALTGVIIGGLIGVVGTGLAGWGVAVLTLNREDRRQAKQHEHERDLAREERSQQRRKAAYETILSSVLAATQALQGWQLHDEVPHLIDEDQLHRYVVQTAMFGSDQVADLLREWARTGRELHGAILALDTLGNRSEGSRGGDWDTQWQENYRALSRLQAQLTKQGDAIVHQMRSELGTSLSPSQSADPTGSWAHPRGRARRPGVRPRARRRRGLARKGAGRHLDGVASGPYDPSGLAAHGRQALAVKRWGVG